MKNLMEEIQKCRSRSLKKLSWKNIIQVQKICQMKWT